MEQLAQSLDIPASIPAARREKVMASLSQTDSLGTDVAFPYLTITAAGIAAQGTFAKRQAEYLNPNEAAVAELEAELRARSVGVVAHYYMDAELQGLLAAVAARFAVSPSDWQHVFIADSLAMGDAALRMAQAGARAVLCLGVDFMSENCRAILDASGYAALPVYRLAAEPIGCSLAAAADSLGYDEWVRSEAEQARKAGDHPVHVVYINTSLSAKARAQEVVPTVACTSSNVVKTILQLAHQLGPRARVLYGPDAYMGQNLKKLFQRLADAPDDGPARAAHPEHTRESVRAVGERMRTFLDGYCLVHHLFGADVVRRIRTLYAGAYATAHLEVPGEMFEYALEAQAKGRGVVGATSDILKFIAQVVEQRLAAGDASRVQFLLGTESGMATSVVRRVQQALAAKPDVKLEVELIFPVSSQAFAVTGDAHVPIVPGVPGGEGCSATGGCASCPFMKMNTLAAMRSVLAAIGGPKQAELAKYMPKQYTDKTAVAGKNVAEVGVIPILAMRHFQRNGTFSQELVDKVLHH
eukprot:m51a1_g14207 putative quinolinate synthetase a subunit (527) ;mRNA; r:156357-158303